MENEKKRVVVTGIGVISPNGIGKDKYWHALLSGKSGIKKISSFNTDNYPVKIAGEIQDFNPEDFMERRKAGLLSRFTQIAFACAKMAVEDSKLKIENEDPYRVGISLGTAIGGLEIAEKECFVYYTQKIDGVNKFSSLSMNPNSATGVIMIEFKIKGYNMTVSTGCSAGLTAIAHAYDSLVTDKADVMIAGGAEAPIFPVTFESFCAADVLSKRNHEPERASRPFDMERDGYVLGEGGGIVILETLEHALKRKANIYAEISGYGMTNDSYSIFKMEPTGKEAAKTIEIALRNSSKKPEDIDYVNAHGSSSLISDRRETSALKTALGEHSYKIPVSSIKSMIGQSLAASSSIQFATTAMVIKTDYIPPTINYEKPDPECDLDYVPNIPRNGRKIKNAMVNAFGAGGNNITVILSKFEN